MTQRFSKSQVLLETYFPLLEYVGEKLVHRYRLLPHIHQFRAQRLAIKHNRTLGRHQKKAMHRELYHNTLHAMASHVADQNGGNLNHAHAVAHKVLHGKR